MNENRKTHFRTYFRALMGASSGQESWHDCAVWRHAVKVLVVRLGLLIGTSGVFCTHASALESYGLVSLIDVVEVSAESLGVLMELPALEGDRVAFGDLLGKVDDRTARVAIQIAELELATVQAQSESNSRLHASESRANVAQAEYDESVAINAQVRQAIPQLRVRRLQLSSEQARFDVEVAQMEQHIVDLKKALKEAELRRAEQAFDRCRVRSPLGGIVVERFKHVGEWVQPGDLILKVCRLDRLRVEWLLDVVDLPPHLAEGIAVSAEIDLGQGTPLLVLGKIDFVSPIVEPTGEYRLWFEFDNPRDEQGNWLLRSGLEAKIRFLEESTSQESPKDAISDSKDP